MSEIGTSNEDGLTLLELLVVLALLALLSALGAHGFSPTSAKLDRAAERVEQVLQRARLSARQSGAEAVLTCRSIRERARAKEVTENCFTPRSSLQTLSFYPDGSADGGAVAVTSSEQTIYIVVNWFDGRVTRR